MVNFGVMMVAIIALIAFMLRPRLSRRLVPAPPVDLPEAFVHKSIESLVDVSALSIAIDWRARKTVQRALSMLRDGRGDYRGGGKATRAELIELLHATANVLREHRVAWLYAGGRDVPPASLEIARGRFNEMVADLRSRYRHELRDDEAPALADPRPEEGEGVVVVSLVVAARGDLLGLRSATDAHSVELHLNRLGNAGLELQAFEAIWSPAAERDRMSTAELEVLYPELQKLDEASQAGRVFCSHCDAPYAGELESCPACGAPRASA